MKPSVKAILVLALVAAVSLLASQETQAALPAPQRLLGSYTTTPTRTTNVNTYCSASLNRSNLVSSQDFSDAQSMRTTVNSQLGIDG